VLPKKRPRRRVATGRPRAYAPVKANTGWAYDFVFDTTATGQQIKCLIIIDEYTREPANAWPSMWRPIRSNRVIDLLAKQIATARIGRAQAVVLESGG